MTTQLIKAIKVLSIVATEVTESMPINCKNGMWTEITNICRLRSQNCQNATSLKV